MKRHTSVRIRKRNAEEQTISADSDAIATEREVSIRYANPMEPHLTTTCGQLRGITCLRGLDHNKPCGLALKPVTSCKSCQAAFVIVPAATRSEAASTESTTSKN